MSKYQKPKPEYILANEIQEDYEDLVTILGVLMNKEGNCYVPVEAKLKKILLDKLQEANISSTVKNRVIDNLKDITAEEDEEFFNHEEWIIPFPNGYYDVRGKKGKNFITEWISDKKFFYQIPHIYNEKFEGDCPIFKDALEGWLGDQKNVNTCTVDDIFEIMGYCLTMNTNLKKAVYIFGPTQTGKTTFQTVLLHILGDKNTSNISLWRMQKNEFGTDGLQLKILNTTGETMNNKIPDVSYFKQLTGGDKFIAVEGKGKEKGRFVNSVKLVMMGNKLPDLVDRHDQAFYDRWIVINFAHQFKVSREKYSDFILSSPDEVQGIIHECLKGVRRLYERGGFRSELIQNNKHIWNYNSDNFYRFIHSRCVLEKDSEIEGIKLKESYIRYVVDNNLGKILSKKLITTELEKYKIFMRQYYEGNRKKNKYKGIRLKTKKELKPKKVKKVKKRSIEIQMPTEKDFDKSFERWEEEQRAKYENGYQEPQTIEESIYNSLTPKQKAQLEQPEPPEQNE